MYRLLIFSVLFACIASAKINQSISGKSGRVIGGVETTIEKFPYIVSLRYVEVHRCGGTIHTFKVVLVAANCIIGLNPNALSVMAGTAHRDVKGVERLVEDTYTHEGYDAWLNTNDIALIILQKPFSFTATIQPIPLSSVDEEIQPGTRAYVAGWGTLIEGGYTQNSLHFTDLYIISKEECAEQYVRINNITDDMICAGPVVGQRGVCYGDFGGPLVIEGKLYGIISWSAGCAMKEYPTVFAKTSKLRKWINEKLATIGL